jgi:NADH-quinone oxidoreductase subunit N
LELLSLALYVLIAIRKGEAYSNEAGLKYFILGAVASGFLTFGIALLYAMSGTLQIMGSLTAALSYPQRLPGIILSLALILTGLGFKLSLVPFHLWVLAALTMAVGNLTALCQTRIKRLLAYSSVAQMGYLFMTLLAVKQGGLPALMFYLVVYAMMDLGAFGLVGSFSAGDPDLEALEDYQGLGYSQPWRAGILAVCLISLAGLPPTAGFMGKFVLFRAVLQAHYPALAVIGILTVIISIYFYLKVVVALYMRPQAAGVVVPGADLAVRVAGALILLAILWLGIMPSPLFTLIARLVAAWPS